MKRHFPFTVLIITGFFLFFCYLPGVHISLHSAKMFPGSFQQSNIITTHLNNSEITPRDNVKLPDIRSKSPKRYSSPLLEHIAHVLDGCGQICNTSMTGEKGLFYDQIKKSLDCPALWANSAIDAGRPAGPAPDIPGEIKHLYDYNGKVPIVHNPAYGILNQHYLGGNASTPTWEKELIEKWAEDCGAGRLDGSYGRDATNSVYQGLKQTPTINGGRVLVVGSENPWVEACVLAVGALHVSTLEYGAITSKHPRVSTLTPIEARKSFLEGSLPLYDAIVTYSSVEHSGLGRYGDQLNPWGDLQAVARAWCVCKPDGFLLLGVMEAPQDRKLFYTLEISSGRRYSFTESPARP